MSLIKKIVNQSAVYFFGTVISVAIGFFFKIYLSRELGAEAIGIYSLGLSVISILGIFMSLGYGNGLVRFVSKYNAKKDKVGLTHYINSTSVINLLIAAPLSVCFFIFPKYIAVNILNTPSLEPYMFLFGLMLFINSFLVLADQTIRGLQEVKKSTLINTFLRLPFKIIIVVVLFSLGWGLEAYIIAELLGSLLALLFLIVLIKRILPQQYLRFKKPSFNKEEKLYNINLLISNSVAALKSHGDKVVLVFYLSTLELGVYSVVLTIVAFVPLVLNSVNSIFSPIISELYSQDKIKELSRQFQLSGRYIFILSFPLLVFIFLFPEAIMSLFGDEFIKGSKLLSLIICGQLINISMGSVGLMLQMCGLEKPLRNISIISSGVCFALYFVLIESWGLIGLGWIYILNMLMLNISCSYVLYKHLNIQLFHSSYFKVIAVFLMLFIFCFFFRNYIYLDISPGLLFLALIIVYVLFFMCWLLCFGKKELPQILKTLNLK